ncbi:MAG: hypothetical protein ACJA2S_004500 [Cyclobacteriaceae bacterium]|jgi:hypothetical protein
MKNLIYTIALTIILVGCDDRLAELNTDKKNPANVSAESLFTRGIREAVDNIVSMSVNDNPFRLYSQQWAQTTYPEESQYAMGQREIPLGIWSNQYRDVLIDLQQSKVLIEEELASGQSGNTDGNLQNRMAILDVLISYTYVTMVDIFGDIPYSEALDPDNSLTPAYDDAASIYNSIEAILSTASSTLTSNSAEGSFGSSDLVYGGSASGWAKFANSIKLRMAMKLADANSSTSVSWANSAMAAGVITSNADNFSMVYQSTSPNSSPMHEDLVLSGRQDFVSANTLVDAMNSVNDPRLMVYFRDNLGGSFDGGIYGTSNSYPGFSQVGEVFHQPETPGVLFNAAESHFLMAEMVERGGYSVTGTVDTHYNAGITASFEQWEGVYNSYSGAATTVTLDLATYMAQPSVAYATATGDWKEKIGKQLWLALYNQGLEAWSTWRRLDFPGFTPPPGMTMADIPVRMTYPLREATLNGSNRDAAASAIGGDLISTKVFWDKN